jgi:hypothetical protein
MELPVNTGFEAVVLCDLQFLPIFGEASTKRELILYEKSFDRTQPVSLICFL